MRKIIGVMGSSHGEIPLVSLELAYEVGQAIVRKQYTLLTGGTLGVPQKAVEGAKSENGLTIAISPASNQKEHIEKFNQSSQSDIYIYTGMGDLGRNIFNIKSSDAVIFICGGMGTLSELAIAYTEGKLIGILSNSGGIAGEAENIIRITKKKPKNKVIYSTNPFSLVELIDDELQQNEKS